MTITNRQKKIVNPYAESLDTSARSGAGYDYNNRRNRFIQDAIQERYIYFFQFPSVGERLNLITSSCESIKSPSLESNKLPLAPTIATLPIRDKSGET